MALLDNIQINRKTITKILIIIAGVAAMIALISFMIDYFTTGEVKINTKQDAQIYNITIVEGKYTNKLLGKSKYSGRFKPGTYTFMAVEGDLSSTSTVKVQSGKSQQINLDINPIPEPKKVISASAVDIQAIGNELNFVNTSYNYLERYIIGNKSQVTYPMPQASANVSSAQWVGKRRALLRLYESSTGYLDDRTLKIFNPLPKDESKNNDVAYVLNQITMNSNLEILSQIDSSLYHQRNISSEPELIVEDIKSSGLTMDLSNTKLYAFAKNYFSAEGIGNDAPDEDKSIFIRNLSDKNYNAKINSNSNIDIIKFSPDSSKLIYSNAEGISVYRFDSQQSVLLYAKQPEKAPLTAWVDNRTIVYIDNGGIWKMDIENLTAKKISKSKSVNNTISLAISEDKNKLYYTEQIPDMSGTKNTVYEIGL